MQKQKRNKNNTMKRPQITYIYQYQCKLKLLYSELARNSSYMYVFELHDTKIEK